MLACGLHGHTRAHTCTDVHNKCIRLLHIQLDSLIRMYICPHRGCLRRCQRSHAGRCRLHDVVPRDDVVAQRIISGATRGLPWPCPSTVVDRCTQETAFDGQESSVSIACVCTDVRDMALGGTKPDTDVGPSRTIAAFVRHVATLFHCPIDQS